MAAITVNWNTYYLESGADPATRRVVYYGDDGARTVLGTVERVERVGARGGSVVRWIARDMTGCRVGDRAEYVTRRDAVGAVMEARGTEADAVEPVVEAPESAPDAPDPVTGVTAADEARYGSVMAARGAHMSHTVTSVENVRGTWNVKATASDGAPEHFTVVPSWGDVRWYARGGECVLPLPVGVTFPDTPTGAVEAVITVMSGPVQWADDAAPYRPTPVTEPTPADIARAAYRTPPAVMPVRGRSCVITDAMTDAASVTITRGAVSVVVSPWSADPDSGWGVWADAPGVDPYAGVKVTTDNVVDVVAGYLPHDN